MQNSFETMNLSPTSSRSVMTDSRKYLFMLVFSISVVLALLLANNAYSQDVSAAGDSINNPYQEGLGDWAATLERFVDDQGRTDFLALSKDTTQLKKFVDVIATVSPSSNPELFPSEQHVFAYHINAYNALAMWGVIERDIPKNFSSVLKRASFFKFRPVQIGGKKTSLYDYENKVIRPLGDARIHFVLNCMVRDCPILPRRVFVAATLEDDLQAAAEAFMNSPKYVAVDEEKGILYLSSIFKFYTKDYVASGKKQDLLEYVNRYRDSKVPSGYKVKYLPYDWTINQSPG